MNGQEKLAVTWRVLQTMPLTCCYSQLCPTDVSRVHKNTTQGIQDGSHHEERRCKFSLEIQKHVECLLTKNHDVLC